MSYVEEAHKIVRTYATEEELERFNAGVLPTEEIEAIVADVIFDDLRHYKKRRKLLHNDIRAAAKRARKATEFDEVFFDLEETQPDALTQEEWNDLKAITASMPTASVTPFFVTATCGEFSKKFVYAKVLVDFHGVERRLDLEIGR